MGTSYVIQKINELMIAQNLSTHKFETEVGLANASVQAWKNGKSKPSADALVKIADYFHVSVDYLLGRTPFVGFSPAESEMTLQKVTFQVFFLIFFQIFYKKKKDPRHARVLVSKNCCKYVTLLR